METNPAGSGLLGENEDSRNKADEGTRYEPRVYDPYPMKSNFEISAALFLSCRSGFRVYCGVPHEKKRLRAE